MIYFHRGRWLFFLLLTAILAGCRLPAGSGIAQTSGDTGSTAFSLDELQRRTFLYFWELADAQYQIPDRWPTIRFSSIAATGFGLTAYITGAERGWVSRQASAGRVLNTLRVLYALPQGPDRAGIAGYKGFFYHFLDPQRALRYERVELSSIDTGLLLAGVLACMTYYDGDDSAEREIRALADALYRRVEWDWMLNARNRLSMGWHPEKGFIQAEWYGYNEAMLLYILALGSPTHTIPASSWDSWCETYYWAEYMGQQHINFGPLFGHQYSHVWIDFRGIRDVYTRAKGIDYFENSRRAVLANRAYCIANPRGFKGYSADLWGLTACDGPRDWSVQEDRGKTCLAGWELFQGYSARGAAADYNNDDGTIAPTAAGGSVPFAPEECLHTLKYMWETYHDSLVGRYGYKDAFNPGFTACGRLPGGWFDRDYLGIDQGPILLMIENHRSGLIWDLMKRNPYIRKGLQRAGFEGGWLAAFDKENQHEPETIVVPNPNVPVDPVSLWKRSEFRPAAGGTVLPYRLLTPALYDLPGSARTESRYPLVLFLHGSGERGNDNEMQLKNAVLAFAEPGTSAEYPCYVLAPQCPAGDRWSEVDYTTGPIWGEDPTGPMKSLQELIAEVLRAYPDIDPDRVYLTGLSMGASGGFDLLRRMPDRFAAAVLVCGAGDPAQADQLNLPVWVFHGLRDDVVPARFSREMVEALKAKSGDVHYTEYTTLRHNCWDQAFYDREMQKWLFACRRRQ